MHYISEPIFQEKKEKIWEYEACIVRLQLAIVLCPSLSIFDAKHGGRALMPYANSEGPDECMHLRSLIWTFSVCRHILYSVSGQQGP